VRAYRFHGRDEFAWISPSNSLGVCAFVTFHRIVSLMGMFPVYRGKDQNVVELRPWDFPRRHATGKIGPHLRPDYLAQKNWPRNMDTVFLDDN